MLAEARLLRSIQHPNIISFHEFFVSSSGGIENLYIVMDFATGGDLARHIDERAKTRAHYSEETTRQVGAGLLQAVGFLHQNHILHGDIKPNNIFIEGGAFKLGDFGLAKIMTNQESAQGGPAYAFFAAPERLMQQAYDYADDIYAIGGVLHCAMGLMQCPYYGTREERTKLIRMLGKQDMANR